MSEPTIPWPKLPACVLPTVRKLKAYSTCGLVAEKIMNRFESTFPSYTSTKRKRVNLSTLQFTRLHVELILLCASFGSLRSIDARTPANNHNRSTSCSSWWMTWVGGIWFATDTRFTKRRTSTLWQRRRQRN
jgi:hypothetical protein